MRRSKMTTRGVLACGAALAATAAAGQAAAQAALQASSPQTVQEVVVTANKRAEKLHDVAMGVTALGGNKLDAEQSVSFLDYAPLIPSLSIQSDAPGVTRLTLRGENTGGVGSTTAVYIDDAPFGSSNALANGSITTGDFDTWDLQRVEVLRGPQGTLYGASTEGGLIKFVQNAPNPSRFEAAGEAGLEGVEHGQTVGDFKAMVNLPLLDGKAALRLSGYQEDLPGWIDDPQLKQKNVNAGSKYGLRASFLYKPTDALTLKLSAVSQLVKTGAQPAIDVVGAALAGPGSPPPANELSPTGGLSQNAFLNQYTKDRIENYSGSLVWNPGPVSVTSVTSYGVLKLSTLTDMTSTEVLPGITYADYFSAFLYGGAQTPDEVQLTGLHKVTQELRIASNPGDKLEWQVGGFYTRENTVIHQVINTTSTGGLPVPGSDLLKAVYTEWAGFADATYHFIPQFDVEAGARWSTNSQSAVTTNYPGLLTTGGGPTTQSPFASNGSDFTYSVAPRWHVDKDTMIYGRVSTGYRPGGPNDVPVGSPAGVPRAYGADSTFNYELGLRSNLLDHRLSVDVAAFHIDWSNIQLFEQLILNNTPYGINGNGGDARSQGVEWTIGLFPITGLTLNWTGAYTDAAMTSISPAATIDAKPGDRLPYVPAWQTSLDGQYEWNLSANYKGFVGATYSFVGSRYSSYLTEGTPGDGYVKLPSYQTLALRAGFENARWRFEAYAKNLTDARGITDYSSQGAPNLQGSINIIQPMTLGVVLSAKY